MTWRHDPSLSVSRAHISHDIAALVVGAVVVVVCHIYAVNEKMRYRSEDTGHTTHGDRNTDETQLRYERHS